MDIMPLFVTPVGVTKFEIEDGMQFLTAVYEYTDNIKKGKLLLTDVPAINSFKNKLKAMADEYAKATLGEVEIKHDASWMNNHFLGDLNTPHYHPDSLFAQVVYLNAPEKCGDLLLLDPRGATNFETVIEDNKSGRAYQRITPVTGMVVMFPSYLLHLAEPNTTNNQRIVMAINYAKV